MNIVPLSKASYCVNCNAISDSPKHHCPACGSDGVVNLRRMIEHQIAAQPQSVEELERLYRA